MADLASLVVKRFSLQKQILRVQTIVNGWNSAALILDEVDRQIQAGSKLEADVRDIHVNTMLKCKGTEFVDDHEADIETLMNAVDVILVKLAKYKRDVTNVNRNTTSPSFKLERIKLPQFGGNFSEWQSFHDLFQASVHNNSTLSGAEKMIHLKSCLTGEASSIVSAFQATEANYVEAWKLVKKRYSNEREIIFSHIKKFDDLKPLLAESSSGLRSISDNINECTRSLSVMGVPVDQWDLILIYFAMKKLDKETRKEWLIDLGDATPTLKVFIKFIETRARALLEPSSSSKSSSAPNREMNKKSSNSNHSSTTNVKSSCPKCSESHRLMQCSAFGNFSLEEKKDFIKAKKLCYICLSKGHWSSDCKSQASCKKCGSKKHNTLLHTTQTQPSKASGSVESNKQTSSMEEAKPNSSASEPIETSSSHCAPQISSSNVVLMGTVVVTADDNFGEKRNCRVFLDSGSESHFISERCVDMLGLKRRKTCVSISGIGGSSSGSATGIVNLRLYSRFRDFSLPINALILPKVTSFMPRAQCNSHWPHLKNIELSDRQFFRPGPIDILLGAKSTGALMLPEMIHGPPGTPTAMNTKFGWILTGEAKEVKPTQCLQVTSHHAKCSVQNECLDSLLESFWKLEELPTEEICSSVEETLCEAHFGLTHQRSQDGSYIVELPFKNDDKKLGHSREAAVKRFEKVENRLSKNPLAKAEYVKCMQENLDSEFMELVPPGELKKPPSECYYLPHREVIKESSTSTKVRIVFDASAKTSSGYSLNDVLMPGPKLQVDLVPLLIRFRSHLVAMSADIVKFYPQFHVNRKHVDFQRLVWRESPELPLQDFRMLRVTFGVTSAAYLAIRCLRQLAEDKEEEYPKASSVIKEEFLVDNLLSGASDIESALQLQHQLIQVMESGNLKLRKWSSNSSDILQAVLPEHREIELTRQIKEDESVKTIGLVWQPSIDKFGINIVIPDTTSAPTKRKVLSSIAKIFDPLGWLSPVTIKPKIIMQQLWKLKLEWDSILPPDLSKDWISYINNLNLLQEFKIDRCIIAPSSSSESNRYELHGFCDASQVAYAACIYLRTTDGDGRISVKLVVAKTKVAPIKSETTPRLELGGAHLLSRLMKTVQNSIKLEINSTHCWTDSKIVLGWLASDSKLPVFIANRVRKIGLLLPEVKWNHVVSGENPADPASRGIRASDFINNTLWLHGPPWLTTFFQTEDVLIVGVSQLDSEDCSVLSTFLKKSSSYLKMKRVVGYCLRFLNNSKIEKRDRNDGPLKVEELEAAEIKMVKCVQMEEFSEEILRCQKGQISKSSVKFLSPFLDNKGMLRVGGRLQNTELAYSSKHPILLPQKHNLTQQLVRHFHLKHLHAGPQLLLTTLRQQFWIVRGPRVVNKCVSRCLVCHRHSARMAMQQMGQLPAPRVTPSRPFSQVGIDYAGPSIVNLRTGRNPPSTKSYVSLFVCMATRAIHLELVSDLSTPAFMAALNRFVSRRGLPNDIYCDGGKNFVGASNELKDFFLFLESSPHKEEYENFLSDKKIKFHFNPPLAPHHGGLWEAGVKSMKHHLKRVIGEKRLSLEEFSTLLCQVEAVLNSRPLTQLSTDPNDLAVLTPGHFLVGDSLMALPQHNLTEINPGRLSRWQLVQQMSQHFWRRWSSEYLTKLQSRPKWLQPQPDLKSGIMVLVRDDDSNWGPTKWKIGRIETVFSGKDGRIRVCDIRAANGNVYRRPIVKLSPLPIYD